MSPLPIPHSALCDSLHMHMRWQETRGYFAASFAEISPEIEAYNSLLEGAILNRNASAFSQSQCSGDQKEVISFISARHALANLLAGDVRGASEELARLPLVTARTSNQKG